MNSENMKKVDQIKAIIDTLSDMYAVTEIERYLYNSRWKIGNNSKIEMNARQDAEQ